jgi:putative N-acetylmannosamine-6-phosphate epimerase
MIADGSKSDQPLFAGYIAARKKPCFFVKAEGINQQPYQLACKMISGSNTVLIVSAVTPFDFRNRVRAYRSRAILLSPGHTLFKTDQDR